MGYSAKKRIRTELSCALAFVLVLCMVLSGCRFYQEQKTSMQGTPMQGEDIENAPDSSTKSGMENVFWLSEEDLRTEYADCSRIELDGRKDNVTIDKGGDYLLAGSFQGQLLIDAKDQLVHLFFDNVEISSKGGPAIYVKSGGKVVITLLCDTVNMLKDSGDYKAYADCKGCVYSEVDLSINGSGRLDVYGYYKDAVVSKDVLKILGGDIHIMAKRDGLRGNDGLVLMADCAAIESEDNAVMTKNSDSKGKGYLVIGAGENRIVAGKRGIIAAGDLYIYQCSLMCSAVIEPYSAFGGIYIEEGCMDNE